MTTNIRTFLRDFTTFKRKARQGEPVRVVDREGDFLFTATASERKSLLGAANGRIALQGDLTRPTTGKKHWKPSL